VNPFLDSICCCFIQFRAPFEFDLDLPLSDATIILYKRDRDLSNAVFVMQFYGRACVYLYSNKESLDLVRDMFVFVCWGKSFTFSIRLELLWIRFGKSFSFSIRFGAPFRFGLDFGRFLLSFYLSEATIILSRTYSSLHRI
jgi:hypothetical protein